MAPPLEPTVLNQCSRKKTDINLSKCQIMVNSAREMETERESGHKTELESLDETKLTQRGDMK